MKEFVVGLDGSDQSRMALRWAAAAGKAADVPVRAVQSWIHPRSGILPIASVPVSAAEMDEQTGHALATAVADVLGPSAAVITEVLHGPTAAALLQTVTPPTLPLLASPALARFPGPLLR